MFSLYYFLGRTPRVRPHLHADSDVSEYDFAGLLYPTVSEHDLVGLMDRPVSEVNVAGLISLAVSETEVCDVFSFVGQFSFSTFVNVNCTVSSHKSIVNVFSCFVD